MAMQIEVVGLVDICIFLMFASENAYLPTENTK